MQKIISPVMTLYYCPGHLSFAPHVILNELGLPFKRICLSIKEGDTRQNAFKQLNPKGKVPILIIEGKILTESSAILFYLAQSYPERKLLPYSPIGVARALEWLNWLSGILTGVVALNFHPSRFSDEPASYDGIRKHGYSELIEIFKQINKKLSENEWALLEGYSIVDPVLLIYFKWGTLLEIDMSQFTYWSAHTKRILLRPAVQKTIKTEEIIF